MKIESELQEKALHASFTEVQQRHFDKLMSELEVISGGLGFAELKAKAEAGSKEALQVMRDYITKKEQIVNFIETKEFFPLMKPNELLEKLRSGPSEEVKENTGRLFKTTAYGDTGLWDDFVESESGVSRVTSATQFLSAINMNLIKPQERFTDSFLHLIDIRCKSDGLYKHRFDGPENFYCNSQLYGVLAFVFDGQMARAKDFYSEIQQSELYDVEAEVWMNRVGEFGEDSSQMTENYLLQVIVEYFLGNQEKAEQVYRDLKKVSYQEAEGMWNDQLSDEADSYVSRVQLLGSLAHGLVEDPDEGEIDWCRMKNTDLWDKKKKMWRYMEKDEGVDKDIDIHTRDQFLENILVAVFKKLNYIET
ncbi:hypothetical protein HN858_00880 [Candidatus Falkowbacteria bacterium]|jgi:hypothetical protein|nr:hypothetical protein [Candidatus Falkowbacteria bacterium]MBT6573973.1 hypothetical protein [Candidatus Falkowbacteria bacterium]MBT7348208.1 hypothetical protein [Candidatus Falkowbacteria bacterium]MBT7500187.1 hypothetical protein [Candidatus Falkowbacteria bacterium]